MGVFGSILSSCGAIGDIIQTTIARFTLLGSTMLYILRFKTKQKKLIRYTKKSIRPMRWPLTMMSSTTTPLMRLRNFIGKPKTSIQKAKSKKPDTAMAPPPNGAMISSGALTST